MKFKKGDLVYIKNDSYISRPAQSHIVGKVCKIIKCDKSGLFCVIDIINNYGYIRVYVDDLILLKETDEIQGR